MISESSFLIKLDGTPCKSCICRTPELIENYDRAIADTTQTWTYHHRLETHNSDGERRLVNLKMEELIALDMYFDRPPEELIFLTEAEHSNLHNRGKKLSEEARKKCSEANKGRILTEEHRKKLSEARKSRKCGPCSAATKAKISAANKGKTSNKKGMHWKLVDGHRVYY